MRTYLFLMPQSRMAPRPRRGGAALVEFALIAVIFFTMLLGMIQFGLYQSTTNTLWNLSREGARFASVKSKPTDAEIRTKISNSAPPNITISNLTINIYPATRVSGEPVAVCLTYEMKDKIIFPGVGKMLSRDRTIPANPPQPSIAITGYNYFTSSTMRVE